MTILMNLLTVLGIFVLATFAVAALMGDPLTDLVDGDAGL